MILKSAYAATTQRTPNITLFNTINTLIGGYSSKNAYANNLSLVGSPYRPSITAGRLLNYYDKTSGTYPSYYGSSQNYIGATRTDPNGMAIDFAYTEVVKKGLQDIINPNLSIFREIVPLQSNSIPGGYSDLSKMLIFGAWSKIQQQSLVPPILPMVKAMDWLSSACTMGNMYRGVDDLNVYDVPYNYTGGVFTPHTSAIAYGQNEIWPGVPVNPIPEIYWQWISLAQYLALGISPSYATALTSLGTIVEATNVGAHVFVPITKTMITNGFDALNYALAFTGYTATIQNTDQPGTGVWVPNCCFNAYNLPIGSLSGDFYITFVVLDSINTGNISAGTLTIPYNGFADSTLNTYTALGSLFDTMVGGAITVDNTLTRSSLLQMIRWCSGSQFARVLCAASAKNYRKRPLWKDSLGVYYSVSNVKSANFTAINQIIHCEASLMELQVHPSNSGGYIYAPTATMTLPYSPDDAVLFTLGVNSTYAQTLFNINALTGLMYVIGTGMQDRVHMSELEYNQVIDYTQVGDRFDINLLMPNAPKIYPKDIFGCEIKAVGLAYVNYFWAQITAQTTIGGSTLFFSRHTPYPLGLSTKMKRFFGENQKSKVMMKRAEGNNICTVFDSAKRFPWFDSTNLLVLLNDTQLLTNTQVAWQYNEYTANGWNYGDANDSILVTPKPMQWNSYGTSAKIVYPLVYSVPIKKAGLEMIMSEVDEFVSVDDSDLFLFQGLTSLGSEKSEK